MLTPRVLNNNFVDAFFNDSFDSMFRTPLRDTTTPAMYTDVKDLGDSYQMEMELPGYAKEDLQASLKDGYLTISAQHNSEKNEQDENGRFVRRERYTGHCKRSFYVGEGLRQEDIKASFENGVLKLLIPKKDTPAVEEQKYIAIE